MGANSIGDIFTVTTWGESHGKALGVVVDGVLPGIILDELDIQKELDRRSPGQSDITTPRKEADKVEILSGIYKGKTTGTPVSMIVYNKNANSKDYSHLENLYRPGHADFTYMKKYGVRDPRGGGRSSARTTIGIVAAGALAAKILRDKWGISVISYVKSIGSVEALIDPVTVVKEHVESNIVRCPDGENAIAMIDLIRKIRDDHDSIGGVVETVIHNLPVGVGDPLYSRLDAKLAEAMLNINASKGFEMGRGFSSSMMKGSESNDVFTCSDGDVKTVTNNAGGVLGGISNGMPVVFRVPFKPTPTIGVEQDTIDLDNNSITLQAHGRHDPCVVPRAVPIVEAMTCIVICDAMLKFNAYLL